MVKKYYVVGNTAEHSGYIDEIDDGDEITINRYYQELAVYDSVEKARAFLKGWLECDSSEYCYTHNPISK